MQGGEPPNVHPVLRMHDHRRDHASLQSSWQSTQRRVVHFTGPARTYHQNPGTRRLSEATAPPAPQATAPAQQDRASRTRHAPRPSRPSHQVVRHPTAEVVRGHGGWRLGDGRIMCAACGHRTSVTAGTIFDRTRTPLTVWFTACWSFATAKDG